MTSSAARQSLRVVVADDDEAMRKLLRALLAFVPHVAIVGEATDGHEAVELVQAADPDLVLLDVDMPRLDGVAAAEVIRSYRPKAQILLHSGGASERQRESAAALGLGILDKSHFREVVSLIEASIPTEPRPVIEPLVLLALAHHSEEGALIVAADEMIPFYNNLAASLLRLPWPAERLSLAALGTRVRVVDADGVPRPIQELPLARALRERTPVSADVVCEFLDDGSRRRFTMTSVPFWHPSGEFAGVGNYLVEKTGA